jgi:TonB family protein
VPRLINEAKPRYTANAIADRAEGTVWLEALVLTDGSVGGVWLTQPLHPELEHMALATVRKRRFSPGLLKGSPVPVVIEIEMSFTLK